MPTCIRIRPTVVTLNGYTYRCQCTGLTMHRLPRVKVGRSFPSHAYLCPPDVGNGSQELGHLERKPESLAALFPRAPDRYALGYGVCRVFSLLRLHPGWRVVYVGRYWGFY
jgi:hypothetical protein